MADYPSSYHHRAVAPPYSPPPRPNIDISSPAPSAPTTRTYLEPRDIQVNLTAAGQIRDIVFGKQRLGAKFIYANSFSSGTLLYLVVGHCEGPVKSITPYYDGTQLQQVSSYWSDPTGLINVWTYDGSQTSVDALSGLTGYDPTWNEVHNGLAYSIIKLQWDAQQLTAVPNFTFDIEGYRLVYDPRTSTRGYSTNPALCVRELLTNTAWGLKVPNDSTHIDDTTFISAANACDTAIFPPAPTSTASAAFGSAGNIGPGTYQWSYTCVNAQGIETRTAPLSSGVTFVGLSRATVTVPVGDSTTASRNVYRTINDGTGQLHYVGAIADNTTTSFSDNVGNLSAGYLAPSVSPHSERYYLNIAFSKQASGDDWLNTLRAHCMGVLTFDNGRYQFTVDAALPTGYVPKKFSEAAFTDELGVSRNSNVNPDSISIARKSRADLFNQVTVNFVDQQNAFSPSSVTVERPSVTSGAEMPRLATYELPGVADKNLATRLAIQMLNRAYDDLTLSFQTSREGIAVLPLDVISFTGGGLSNQLFRVDSVSTKGEDYVITATEYQAASYSDQINAEDVPVTSTLPNPFAAPPNATGLSVSEDVPTGPSGGFTSKIKVSWTPAATPFYKTTRITVNDGLTSYVWGEAATGPIYIQNPRRGAQHTITLYTISDRNLVSTGISATITPVFTASTVPDVQNVSLPFTTDNDRGTIIFSPPSYDFVDHYEVFDTYNNPANPPKIATIKAAEVAGSTIRFKAAQAIHGDGYASALSMSVLIKVVSVLGDKSVGVPASWTIPAHGVGSYTVGYDPRDCIFDGTNVWVSNFNSANVHKLDRSTGNVLASVSVGTKPFGITYAAGDLWVANFGDNTVTRFTTAGTVVTTISLGASTGPTGLVYDATNGAVWVSCYIGGTIKRISTASNTVTNTVTVGSNPCLLYVLNGSVYVCNAGSNTVSAVNLTTYAVTATIQVGSRPFGLCSAFGYLYVANYASSTVTQIDPSSNAVTATVSLGFQTGPTDCVFDGTYVWVSEAQARQLTRINVNDLRPTAHWATPSSPRTVIWDGTDFWTPNNQNGTSGTLPVTITNPAPGGGTSAAVNLVVNGVDLSPFPS